MQPSGLCRKVAPSLSAKFMAGHSAVLQGSRVVELCDGSQVVVPDSLECLSTYVLLEQQDWFEDELRFLRRLLRPGQVVIDIGANVGVYALSLARCVGPEGQVWAFEPASEPAALLTRSIERNATPWVRLQQQALSDHGGSGWLHEPGQSELNALVADPGGVTAPAGERVALTSLDACLDQHGWSRVDLLKIDAEGEEARILNGGERFFAALAPLVLFELKAGETLHLELIARFARLGYSCFRLVPGLDALLPFDSSDSVDGYLLNLFAVPTDRVPALIEAEILIDPEQTSLPAPGAGELDPPASRFLAGWEAAHDLSRPLSARYGALRPGDHHRQRHGPSGRRQRPTHLAAAAPPGRVGLGSGWHRNVLVSNDAAVPPEHAGRLERRDPAGGGGAAGLGEPADQDAHQQRKNCLCLFATNRANMAF